MIVPTLDDLTLIISVTLLCPLGRMPRANVSTTCMLCIVLQHGRDCSPLQRRWIWQVPFAADHQTYTYTSHSHGGTTDSTQSPLSIDAIDTKDNESFRATRTKNALDPIQPVFLSTCVFSVPNITSAFTTNMHAQRAQTHSSWFH